MVNLAPASGVIDGGCRNCLSIQAKRVAIHSFIHFTSSSKLSPTNQLGLTAMARIGQRWKFLAWDSLSKAAISSTRASTLDVAKAARRKSVQRSTYFWAKSGSSKSRRNQEYSLSSSCGQSHHSAR